VNGSAFWTLAINYFATSKAGASGNRLPLLLSIVEYRVLF